MSDRSHASDNSALIVFFKHSIAMGQMYTLTVLKLNMINKPRHDMRKPVFGVFDQVRHKPACAATEAR